MKTPTVLAFATLGYATQTEMILIAKASNSVIICGKNLAILPTNFTIVCEPV
jgi:hypothetical protein